MLWPCGRPALSGLLPVPRATSACLTRLSSTIQPDARLSFRFFHPTSRKCKTSDTACTRSAAHVRPISEPSGASEETESSVARGTRYEHLCRAVLNEMFGMELERTGGAGDRGIDLRGWWTPERTAGQGHPEKRIRILAQCKCQDEGGKKMGPVLIREMEGVVFRASSPPPIVCSQSESNPATSGSEEGSPLAGIILSSSGFSKHALLQVRSSSVPLAAIHILAQPQASCVDPVAPSDVAGLLERCVSIVWNDRFGAPSQGLLSGGMEVRWVRSLSVRNGALGRPVIYRAGQPLR